MLPIDEIKKIRNVIDIGNNEYVSPGKTHWWFKELHDGGVFIVGMISENIPHVTYDNLWRFVLEHNVTKIFSDIVYGDVVEMLKNYGDDYVS